jgi:hypothetical protein
MNIEADPKQTGAYIYPVSSAVRIGYRYAVSVSFVPVSNRVHLSTRSSTDHLVSGFGGLGGPAVRRVSGTLVLLVPHPPSHESLLENPTTKLRLASRSRFRPSEHKVRIKKQAKDEGRLRLAGRGRIGAAYHARIRRLRRKLARVGGGNNRACTMGS